MHIIYAEKYVSPRERPLTPEEAEVRWIAYALKMPTEEAERLFAQQLAPLVDSHVKGKCLSICLMPVPTSTNDIRPNWKLCRALAYQLIYRFGWKVFIKTSVLRQHPVESSCFRRRHGKMGITLTEHGMIRVCKPLTITGTAYYFVDNMATTGTTLEACRQALGFGDGVVYADQGKVKP